MRNFKSAYVDGQKDRNKGLYLGEGLDELHKAINGLQRGRFYALASSPKVGKSTFLNYGFIINPLLDAIKQGVNVKYYYFSLEMSTIDQMFMFATYFMWKKHNVRVIHIDTKKDGLTKIELSAEFLRGRILDDDNEIIKVPKEVEDILFKVYEEDIIPLFGEYDDNGMQIKKGYIDVIEASDNPTGIFHFLLDEAKNRGTLIKKKFGDKERIVSYIPNDPNEFVVICFDHVRKLIKEREYDKKQNIDKLAEYFVILRNLLNWSFVAIIHLNRSLSDLERFKQFKEFIYPDSDMVKDTGNISEDCDYLITMFNPNDDKYNLQKHFGVTIKDAANNIFYPFLRTLHLVESRHTIYPIHFRVNMIGNLKDFVKFIK